jgi:hypothetical protein
MVPSRRSDAQDDLAVAKLVAAGIEPTQARRYGLRYMGYVGTQDNLVRR